ncbi:MAG: helix-turn-helix domain-containing protein [Solirubrobacteraceae bacterium MAG38_C4-C5]|nr:helix-turn-helix domain-containing protein [Candidatus Siliceabacter maunaloa]
MDDGFGRLLRRARKDQGLSQQRLAVRAGTSQAYISAVERGRVSARLEQADRLLRCLGQELQLSTRPMPMRSDPDTLARLEALLPQERIERCAEAYNFQAMLRERAGDDD